MILRRILVVAKNAVPKFLGPERVQRQYGSTPWFDLRQNPGFMLARQQARRVPKPVNSQVEISDGVGVKRLASTNARKTKHVVVGPGAIKPDLGKSAVRRTKALKKRATVQVNNKNQSLRVRRNEHLKKAREDLKIQALRSPWRYFPKPMVLPTLRKTAFSIYLSRHKNTGGLSAAWKAFKSLSTSQRDYYAHSAKQESETALQKRNKLLHSLGPKGIAEENAIRRKYIASARARHMEKSPLKRFVIPEAYRLLEDPDEPKRPPSGYIIFAQEARHSMDQSKSVVDTAQDIGAQWRGLSNSQKDPYLKRAAHEMAIYKRNIVDYRSKMGTFAIKPLKPKLPESILNKFKPRKFAHDVSM